MLQPLRTPQMLRNGHGCIANGEGRMLQGMTRMHEGWSSSEACCDAGRRSHARMMRGGSFKGCGMQRREGVRGQCCVHGFARTDEAKRPQADEGQKKRAWRLPTLPRFRSTIGVRALDFRVRDGNGYFHSAMATKPTQTLEPDSSDAWSGCSGLNAGTRWTIWSSRSDD